MHRLATVNTSGIRRRTAGGKRDMVLLQKRMALF